MATIELITHITAPLDRCFDLSRSIELHQRSLDSSGERAVAGVTAGLIGLGETVTWEARHFGVRQRLTTRITAFDRPRHFRDSMVAGAFRRFDHDHWFDPADGGGTLVRDVFDFDAPLALLGRIAEKTFLTRYMRRLLTDRNAVIQRAAESEAWREYLTS
ncbi:MAG TPA: SRPBCC family protein [Gemmatimonadaceae bacterium]